MNCDRIARWYRWLEYAAFGRALEQTRLEYLDETASARHSLVLGDGDGRFLAALASRNERSEIDAVDLSREMIRLADGRLKRAGTCSPQRVRLHHADALKCQLPAGRYDLIATHFFLDCFAPDETCKLISQIARAAAPDAKWLVSEFRHPESGFGRYRAGLMIWASYLFFRFATGLRTKTLPDYSRALVANGFRRCSYRMRSNGMLIAELWERA
jgi:ubiquinone/menaquinone biosynthesis C-methylase UbiE